ncbi:MAG TPA: Fe-S cluster assembly protein SufD [Rhizomicrobium sp.]
MSSQAAEAPIPASFDLPAIPPLARHPGWLDDRRASALKAFRANGLPHRRVEEWKYSDLRNAIEGQGRNESDVTNPAPDPFEAIAGPRLVVRDGAFDAALSSAEEVEFLDLALLDDDAPDWVRNGLGQVLSNSMGNASLALMRGGVAIRISRGTAAQLHLRFLQETETMHARVFVEVEDGASLLLLESHAGVHGVGNLGIEIFLRANAQMTHVRLAEPAPDAIRIEEIGVVLARDARYFAHLPQTGAQLSRLELSVDLQGSGAEAALDGAGVLGDRLHADVTTRVDHSAANTASTQLFKYIAGGHSRAIYQGKIAVHKGADGSDSRQTAKAILTGQRAEADLKPELEILADDVKCAHGAAVGDLDADSLFYLRSRGISEGEARELLVRAFIEETVTRIKREDVRTAVWGFLEDALPRALEVSE